jgi:hypothetical protein
MEWFLPIGIVDMELFFSAAFSMESKPTKEGEMAIRQGMHI